MGVPITSHEQKNTWGEEDVHTSAWDLKRQNKFCKFGLKGEVQWSLKWRRKLRWSIKRREIPTGHSSGPISSSCLFFGRRTTSQKGSPSQKKDIYELFPTLFLHTHNRRRIKIEILYLYIYEFFIVCPAVQYTTRLEENRPLSLSESSERPHMIIMIPIAIGALETISKGLVKGLEDLKVRGQVENIQTTALSRSVRILRRVLENWGDLRLFKL